jgi:hypothetical protein
MSSLRSCQAEKQELGLRGILAVHGGEHVNRHASHRKERAQAHHHAPADAQGRTCGVEKEASIEE